MSSVLDLEAQEMSRVDCGGGAGPLHHPSSLAVGQKSWQLLTLKCTQNTPCGTSGRCGGGCCTIVRWKVYFVYNSAKHSVTMCSLMHELKYIRVYSDLADTVPLCCQSRPVCSCLTTSFKSEPSLSSLLCDRCQRLIAPLPAPLLTDAELQTVLQTPLHLKMKRSSLV